MTNSLESDFSYFLISYLLIQYLQRMYSSEGRTRIFRKATRHMYVSKLFGNLLENLVSTFDIKENAFPSFLFQLIRRDILILCILFRCLWNIFTWNSILAFQYVGKIHHLQTQCHKSDKFATRAVTIAEPWETYRSLHKWNLLVHKSLGSRKQRVIYYFYAAWYHIIAFVCWCEIFHVSWVFTHGHSLLYMIVICICYMCF